MFIHDTLLHRLKRGCETMAYPRGPAPALPGRHGGALRVDSSKCPDACRVCVPLCPTRAISRELGQAVVLDMGSCVFCAACVEGCPQQAITQTGCLLYTSPSPRD